VTLGGSVGNRSVRDVAADHMAEHMVTARRDAVGVDIHPGGLSFQEPVGQHELIRDLVVVPRRFAEVRHRLGESRQLHVLATQQTRRPIGGDRWCAGAIGGLAPGRRCSRVVEHDEPDAAGVGRRVRSRNALDDGTPPHQLFAVAWWRPVTASEHWWGPTLEGVGAPVAVGFLDRRHFVGLQNLAERHSRRQVGGSRCHVGPSGWCGRGIRSRPGRGR